jgi:hypothetical protein
MHHKTQSRHTSNELRDSAKQHSSNLSEVNMQNLAPQPIGYISKQNIVFRLFKAIKLYTTTNYNWKLSWHQAAK